MYAQNVVNVRQGKTLMINGADTFFCELAENVKALSKILEAPAPIFIAKQRLKGLLAEENSEIELHDFFVKEATSLATSLSSFLACSLPSEEQIDLVDVSLDRLRALLSTFAFWARRKDWETVIQLFQQIAEVRKLTSSEIPGIADYAYIALLYSVGIPCVLKRRYDLLSAIIFKAPELENAALVQIRSRYIALQVRLVNDTETYQISNRLLKKSLREFVPEFVPTEFEFRKAFMKFEYLLGIMSASYGDVPQVPLPLGLFAQQSQFEQLSVDILRELRSDARAELTKLIPAERRLTFEAAQQQYHKYIISYLAKP
jgi:hypothetical protein